MAHIAIVTNATHNVSTRIAGYLTAAAGGHTTAQVLDADILTTDFSVFDCIVVARSDTSGTVLRHLLTVGKPIVVCGTFSGAGASHLAFFGTDGLVSNGGNSQRVQDASHPILAGIPIAGSPPNQTFQIHFNDFGTRWTGGAIAGWHFLNSTNGVAGGQPTSTSLEVGDLDVNGELVTQRRVLIGGAYPNGNHLHANGQNLVRNAVTWALEPPPIPEPPEPDVVTLDVLNHETIRISVEVAGAQPTRTLHISTVQNFVPGAGNRIEEDVVDGDYDVFDLQPFTKYYVKVLVCNPLGCVESNQASATTDPAPPFDTLPPDTYFEDFRGHRKLSPLGNVDWIDEPERAPTHFVQLQSNSTGRVLERIDNHVTPRTAWIQVPPLPEAGERRVFEVVTRMRVSAAALTSNQVGVVFTLRDVPAWATSSNNRFLGYVYHSDSPSGARLQISSVGSTQGGSVQISINNVKFIPLLDWINLRARLDFTHVTTDNRTRLFWKYKLWADNEDEPDWIDAPVYTTEATVPWGGGHFGLGSWFQWAGGSAGDARAQHDFVGISLAERDFDEEEIWAPSEFPPPPDEISAEGVTVDSINVTIVPGVGGGEVDTRTLHMSKVSGFTPGQENQIAEGVEPGDFLVEGLDSDTIYCFKTIVCNSTGCAESNEACAATLSTLCSMVLKMDREVLVATPDCIHVPQPGKWLTQMLNRPDVTADYLLQKCVINYSSTEDVTIIARASPNGGKDFLVERIVELEKNEKGKKTVWFDLNGDDLRIELELPVVMEDKVILYHLVPTIVERHKSYLADV